MHTYSNTFFNYIEHGAIASAHAFASHLVPLFKPKSLLDVGCGRGAWLSVWKKHNVPDVLGVDGNYVDRETLLVGAREFQPTDLSRPFDLGRRFDIATSFEVAEHLPPESSATFVESIVKHAGRVVFSAATPGQGGENHINERPIRFWQELFGRHDFLAYDAIRPALRQSPEVQPWYKFNSILYAHKSLASTLPPEVTQFAVGDRPLQEEGDLPWRTRRVLVRPLPRPIVTWIAQKLAQRRS